MTAPAHSVESAGAGASHAAMEGVRPVLLGVASGKGGVGKSFLTAALSWGLAEAGWRVLAVDADFGGPNLHTCLGVPASTGGSLSELSEEKTRLESVVSPTGQPRLKIICGTSGPLHAPNIKPAAWAGAVEKLRTAPVDFVLIDLGAGASYVTVDLLLRANKAIVLSTPEPTGMENAYRLLKTMFFRFVASRCENERMRRLVNEALYAGTNSRKARSPVALLNELRSRNAGLSRDIEEGLSRLDLSLIANQVRPGDDRDLADAMALAVRKVFALPCKSLGTIPYDEQVGIALRQRRPFFSVAPESPAAMAVRHLVEGFGRPEESRIAQNSSFREEVHL